MIFILRARAPAPEAALFDPALLPAHVRDRLAVVGYWTCDRNLRGRLDGWDELGELEQLAAVTDLELLGAALAR